MEDSPQASKKRSRYSQRQVKSCGFCYRHKVKCDKVFPCSRCVSRGLSDLCEQESGIVNGGQASGSEAGRQVRRQPTLPQLVDENKSLHRRLNSREKVIRQLMDQVRTTQARLAELEGDSEGIGGSGRFIEAGPSKYSMRWDAIDDMLAEGEVEEEEANDGQPWGKRKRENSAAGSGVVRGVGPEWNTSSGGHSLASSPDPEVRAADFGRIDYLATAGQVYGLSGIPTAIGQQPSHLFAQPGAETLLCLRSIVPLKHSSALVRWHCNYLHWIHPVFHIPSYLKDHDDWTLKLMKGDLVDQSYDFYALYYAILACSLYFMDESVALSIGFTQQEIKMLPRFWFDTALNCLQLSGFMVFPTLLVLQTICVLPMIAHAFDNSKYVTSLMHCALGLARDQNFHLVTANTPPDLFGGTVRSELIRRIWWCLKLSESLSPAAQYPYHLTYPEAWTSPPANVDDHELIDGSPVRPHELSYVTNVSHLLIMGRLSDLVRDFCHSFTKKDTLASRYRCVQVFDERLSRLFDDTPELRPVKNEVYLQGQEMIDVKTAFNWKPWSRYLWAAAVSTRRIQLYRWFLGRSYTDKRFAEVRTICVNAARTSLALREVPAPSMFLKNWHVSSYTIVSGMVLAIELIHGKLDAAAAHQLQAEVAHLVTLLKGARIQNAMVRRGTEILDRMLLDAEASQKRATNLGPDHPREGNRLNVKVSRSSATQRKIRPKSGAAIASPSATTTWNEHGREVRAGPADQTVTGSDLSPENADASVGDAITAGGATRGPASVGGGVEGGVGTGFMPAAENQQADFVDLPLLEHGGIDDLFSGLGPMEFTQDELWPANNPIDLNSDLLNTLLGGDSWWASFPAPEYS